MTKITWNRKRKEKLLEELWANAAFLEDSFEKLQHLVEEAKTSTSIEAAHHEIFTHLVTVRNRMLISSKEQEVLANTNVAFFGLSVGSHAAITWVMESRANKLCIADPDIIMPSNLNRLRQGPLSIGQKKALQLKREIQKIHPFISIQVLQKCSIQNMEEFCHNNKVDVIIDAIDDLEGKVQLRKIARERKIPLVMATDVGDNVILDVERYDTIPQPQLFLGRAKGLEKIDFRLMTLRERLQITYRIVGFRDHSSRMLWSLSRIGEEIKTWPQLAATATIAGGVIATTIKKIRLGEKVLSGRYYISMDTLLNKEYGSAEEDKKRRKLIQKITDSLK